MGTFREDLFEKKLLQLRETHESISNLSSWCLSNESHHQKIVSTWLNVLKRVKIEHRLILFYLANDVIQYSKRKNLAFTDSFAPALQKATTLVREDSVKNKILRVFKIWDERGIYDEAFLLDLSGLLVCDPKRNSRMDVQDFQPNVLYSRIRSCKKLEDATDMNMKSLNESSIPLTDISKMTKSLKEREHGEDMLEEFEKALSKMKAYVDALESEIKERSGLLDLLDVGEQYYEKDFKEAKIVVNAYKCFSQRVKQVQKKLEERIAQLPSPVPSPPDANAPSPPLSPNADEKEGSALCGNDFTLGESFINNSSSILPNTSVNSSQSEVPSQSFYKDSESLINNFYTPPSYNPVAEKNSSAMLDVEPYVPEPYTPKDVPYTPGGSSYYSKPSQSYSEEYFTGASGKYDDYNSKANDSGSLYDSTLNGSSSETPTTMPTPANTSVDPSTFSSFLSQLGRNPDKSMFTAPPPPPPPANASTEGNSGGNKIEVISSTTPVKINIKGLLEALMPKSTPLKPPPMPPSELQTESQEKFTWNDSEWDSPESPIAYENLQYSSPAVLFEEGVRGSDTDLRKKDVDHRNLINLTGPSSTNWTASDDKSESNFNSSEKYWSSGSESHESEKESEIQEQTKEVKETTESVKQPSNQDNVENVDMEMSDEEERNVDNNQTKPSSVKVPQTPIGRILSSSMPFNNLTSNTPPPPTFASHSYQNNKFGVLNMMPPPPPPPPPPPTDTWFPPPPNFPPHNPPPPPHMFPQERPFFQHMNRPFRPPLRPFNRPHRFQNW